MRGRGGGCEAVKGYGVENAKGVGPEVAACCRRSGVQGLEEGFVGKA